MAIEQGIWKIGDKPEKLQPSGLADESLLEEQVMHDIAILDADWLLIGRQVRTDFDKFIDLLALDGDGNVIIIELKRDKTPREVVAQAIDYASWVVNLDESQIGEIYRQFAERYGRAHDSLEAAFEHLRASLWRGTGPHGRHAQSRARDGGGGDQAGCQHRTHHPLSEYTRQHRDQRHVLLGVSGRR